MRIEELRVALTVENHQQALAFYRDALGLTELADWSSDQGKVVLLDGGHATLELIDARQAALIDQIEVGTRVAGPTRLALRMENEAALESVLEQVGSCRLGAIIDTPWGDRNVRLSGPDDMQLTLFTEASPQAASQMKVTASTDQWPWPHELDALIAAPGSHRLLFENDRLRVLEVMIESGAREPEHTHRSPSVMIVDRPARIRYYEHGVLTFESPAGNSPQAGPKASWMEAEGPHAVENIDSSPYRALRVELRDPESTSSVY
jgi:methylmalonyl-CoA/ethylmalonyl-CoA epimerase